jgi:hypothetical protein
MPEDTRSEEGEDPTEVDPSLAAHRPHGDPRPAAVTFVTTEHFTLQGARAATIAESTGRASMFLFSLRAAWWRWDWSRQRAGLAPPSMPSGSFSFPRLRLSGS